MIEADEIIHEPRNCKPHVVLLGAGASRAAFPDGDAAGKALPVMNDLVDVIGLKLLLEQAGIESTGNFEVIYSRLKNRELKNKIENEIFDYFENLSLPSTATIYDQLLLSLREKDAIFTFNWDPFLFDAYSRNKDIASLPNIFFLHGNVRIGECKRCAEWGIRYGICPTCNKNFTDVPLLYPIEDKHYADSSPYIKASWESVKNWFTAAFTITIFGYGAPVSDVKAVELLKEAWLKKSSRKFEHIEVIDILCSEQLTARWKAFTPTFHSSHQDSFEKSRLCSWPRRSSEMLFSAMSQGSLCEGFPPPKTNNLAKLQNAIKKIAQLEDNSHQKI
ncbi:MAG: hypothetical protein GKR77_05120 [Legionellales bacterium]|nr:hypothetical protein [Legionellales bacterium]